VCLVAFAGVSWAQPDRDVLYQTSTIGALMIGVYDGPVTFGQLRQHGDFGLGTFNALDGEMVAVDGEFYQITADGIAHRVEDATCTPFAAVTFLDRDYTTHVEHELTFAQLTEHLERSLPTKNVFYAIRVDGTFSYMKTRSVPRQQRPYPKLADVVATQPTFEWHDVKGTLVGFRCPAYIKGINVPGYHFHFIDDARTKGGHVLECRVRSGTVTLDLTREFLLALPESEDFDRAALDGADEQTTDHPE